MTTSEPQSAPLPPSPAAPESETQSSLSARVITGAIVVIVLNVLYQVATSAEYRAETEWSFRALTVVVTAGLIAATVEPRVTGHILAVLFGVSSLLGGVVAGIKGSVPVPLILVLTVMGAGSLWMTVSSFRTQSRAAWAFLSATLGVMGVCTLFGAPKVRTILEVSMWTALMIPGLLTVACIAMGMIGDQYRDRVTPRR